MANLQHAQIVARETNNIGADCLDVVGVQRSRLLGRKHAHLADREGGKLSRRQGLELRRAEPMRHGVGV